MDFEQQVAVALHATAERVAPPVDDLVRRGGRRGQELRRRRARAAVALGRLVGVAAAAVSAFGPGIGRSPQTAQPPAAASPAAATCPPPRTDALPEWASAGFSDPKGGGIPWVMGEHENIVAVLFGQPLSAPEAKDHANKILWVSQHGQQPMEPLVVTATAGRSLRPQPVVVTIPGGPGPSYLELPYPGCWHLDLSWDNGKQRDSMDLAYVKPGS